jgi:hypothetical protein
MSMDFDDWEVALNVAQWSRHDLWLASLALGENMSLTDVEHFVAHDRDPSPAEHEVLAVALNERLHDLGHDHPIAYRDPSA